MKAEIKSLSKLLKSPPEIPDITKEGHKKLIKKLQHLMLITQQGVWHKKERVVILFEGFDAAGKGGAIRKLTEGLDPRGIKVFPIGPPKPEEQGKHWLYRFWTALPLPGEIVIFDRSWYGRVLVEKVEELVPKAHIERAYQELNELEESLTFDGIHVIKIFLAISKDEQYQRFQDRLDDPYKQWKITKEDLKAREKWDDYVKASDEIFKRTQTKSAPWHLIFADNKKHAREEVVTIVTNKLSSISSWMEDEAKKTGKRSLAKALKELED